MRRSMVMVMAMFIVVAIGNIIFAAIELDQGTSSNDPRSLYWERFDVSIEEVDTAANSFVVTEFYTLVIERGPYSFGFAEIPQDRLERISDVVVYENRSPLQGGCYGGAGSFCAQDLGDVYSIRYYFTQQAQSGDRKEIAIRYAVHGALRSYSEGDQLYWVAIPGDRPFPIRSSTIKVTLPPDRPPQLIASYPDTWEATVDGSVITWQSPGPLDSDDVVEVRVQYPHDERMPKPSWQAGFDRERAYVDNWQPLVSLLILALTVLFTLAGVLFVVTRYLSYGRDPKALVVPEYLSERPTDELPGIVGLLVDEKADMKDILATLIDLARRGYLVIEQSEEGGLAGFFTSDEFTFHRTEKPADDLRPFERTLLRGIFSGSKRSTTLSKLRNRFYKHIPKIKTQMYEELVRQGYFTRSPETTRQLWIWGGIVTIVLASVLFWIARELTLVSPLIVLPPIGLGVVGLAAALFGDFMPAKTQKGSQDAAKWRAFERYLATLERQDDIQAAAQRFDEFIAYAIAFGLENELVKRVVPAMTQMPGWYFPTHLGGPWHGGYHSGRGVRPFSHTSGRGLDSFSLGGPGGLNDMSHSLTDGLNAMNSGLTRMLNSASRAMTSRPSSSGSGGFSGGGGGGGGSGGGSRGFG